jgi:hypothetical protein
MVRRSRNNRHLLFAIFGFTLCIIATLGANESALAEGAAGERIPEIHSTSFANQKVDLPADLRGKAAGVLVLGFSHGSRDAVTGWAGKIAADYRTSFVVAYYELPVVASVPGLARGLVLRSIKSSVPERAQKRVVPIVNNEAKWREIVQYGPPDDPYLLVVDGDGNVAWQTHGPPTDAAYAALKQQVEALKIKAAR